MTISNQLKVLKEKKEVLVQSLLHQVELPIHTRVHLTEYLLLKMVAFLTTINID